MSTLQLILLGSLGAVSVECAWFIRTAVESRGFWQRPSDVLIYIFAALIRVAVGTALVVVVVVSEQVNGLIGVFIIGSTGPFVVSRVFRAIAGPTAPEPQRTVDPISTFLERESDSPSPAVTNRGQE